MGTWDDGILDNDTSLDGLGDLSRGVVDDIAALEAVKPGARAAGRLAAAVGVLLQLSSYDFSSDSPSAARILAALRAHEAGIAKLSPRARATLGQVLEGRGSELAGRPAKLGARVSRMLHKGGRAGFGKREAALFEGAAAAAYVQEIAKRCVAMVDGDFEEEDNWSDLCREGTGMGALAVLLVLEPCRVPRAKIERWRRAAQKGLAQLEAEPNEELGFQRVYYKNLDGVFAALLARFA